jgi:hypothetical protein
MLVSAQGAVRPEPEKDAIPASSRPQEARHLSLVDGRLGCNALILAIGALLQIASATAGVLPSRARAGGRISAAGVIR